MTAAWRIEPIPELAGYSVDWLQPGNVLLSRRNRIYRAASPTGPRELIAEIPAARWKRWAARRRWAQRLLRFLVYNALPLLDDTVFVTFDRQAGVVSGGRYREIRGMARPCRVLRRGCALAPGAAVYWGEYLKNEERRPVRIYRYDPGDARARVVYTFGAGEIRHVHGVYADPYSDSLWCLTGDLPAECRILRTGNAFESLEVVGAGDETWRAVSLLFTSTAIFYASDAEFRCNHVYRLDRRSGHRAMLAPVDGPVYYSHAIGEDLFFATAAELCRSQRAPVSSLWHVAPDGDVTRISSFTKDYLRRRLVAMLFMPGTLNFPSGPGHPHETYVSVVGLKGADDRTLRLYRG